MLAAKQIDSSLLRRTRGGAVPIGPLFYEPFRHDTSFQDMVSSFADERRRIACAAAQLVQPGETIALSGGTTTTEVARSLKALKGISIITNTVNVAMELCSQPESTIPYPPEPIGKETAHVYLANFTHVFSATTTNEFVFAYCEFINDNIFSNLSNASRTKLGFPAESLFGAPKTYQIPNMVSWSAGLTEILEFDFNSGIFGPGTFGKTSKAPSIADTFTRSLQPTTSRRAFTGILRRICRPALLPPTALTISNPGLHIDLQRHA